MSNFYGRIVTTVWESQKFRALPDHECKLGFLWICANPDASTIGVYRIRPEVLGLSVSGDHTAGHRILEELVKVGLIDWAGDFVRIVQYYRQLPPDNFKQILGAIRKFHKLDITDPDMRDRTAIEMAFFCARRVREMKPSDASLDLGCKLNELIEPIARENPSRFLALIEALGLKRSDPVWREEITLWITPREAMRISSIK